MSHGETCLTDDKRVILVIADDSFGATVAEFCQDVSIQIYLASTADLGMTLAGKNRPDLIMIDADLPGINPADWSAAFKADGELPAVPIVILVSPERDKEVFRQAGCNDFIVKPLEQNAIFPTLCKYFPATDRRNERVPYYTPVTIKDKDEFYFGLTGDVSMGGVFVATFDRLPENGDIQLSFALEKEEPSKIEVKGRVAWINSKKRPVNDNLPEGFGVEFNSISTNEIQAIRDLIAAKKK
jgi:CheY-like chemotaxis protein